MKTQNTILMTIAVISAVGIASFSYLQDNQEVITYDYFGSQPNIPLDELAQLSDYAIKGKVVSITPQPVEFINDAPLVMSDVVIDVKKDLYGKYTDNQITVRLLGGESGKYKINADVSPKFEVGKKVMVLVHAAEPDSIFGDNYYVSGWDLGKYDLSDNGKAKHKNTDRDMLESELDKTIKEAKSKGKDYKP